jgi:two-component system sensor histidine kinase ChvG
MAWLKYLHMPGPTRLLPRLVFLNMLGLVVLSGGFLLLSESRQVLTNAYKQSLEAQARIIAGALGQAVNNEPFQFLEPSLLGRILSDRRGANWQVREAERIMRRVGGVSNARLRLYGRDGRLLIDSAQMDRSIGVISRQLPPLPGASGMPVWYDRMKIGLERMVRGEAPILSEIIAADGYQLPEVASALKGRVGSLQRRSADGEDVLTVAVPVQGYRAIIGALMLSTPPGEIDQIIAQERRVVLELSALALGVSLMTSVLIAGMVVVPVRRLAGAMRGFGQNTPSLPGLDTVPDFSRRSDEIGELSEALRDMLRQLLQRINMIDRFAADVAHELKNPLTSLHSAVQSLPSAKDAAQKAQLLAIIEQDVFRLNRLISDISNATRLDAELNRGETERFDLSEMARDIGDGLAQTMQDNAGATLSIRADAVCPIWAQKPRIAQIITNLLANAASFSPQGGQIMLTVRPNQTQVELIVADEGPGVAEDMRERIFERFYTDRGHAPERNPKSGSYRNLVEDTHSGLGLSISRQIARAHGGELEAANRPDGTGAYFTLTLPLATAESAA